MMGATMGSETTAAAAGKVGVVRRDPMAMLPFCGYNIGDYLGHWLEMGTKMARSRRESSWSTGFARTATASSCGPAIGENLRVLKWMLDRIEGKVGGNKTAVGIVPKPEDIDLQGSRFHPAS